MPKPILRALASIALFLHMVPVPAMAQQRGPLVLAAASMQEAMGAAADAWAAQRHARPVLSFAASSALARQIRGGAPADLFVSADEDWMDDVERAGFVQRGSRADMAGNRLVLIAPARAPLKLRIARGMPIARALGDSRLAMANPDSVPAGKYGKAALGALGVWPGVANRLALGDNVRSALTLVERGEARLGIVYATDARASKAVLVVGAFPAGSHAPIRYPLARLRASRNPDAEGFRRFLLSRAGQNILARYGFSRP
ncbi:MULTISPECIES: molybdate ABC transporter substrate-binding protein [Sphingobium]|uniref:Molybdate ABC transporter substrate-binding protein n=2 Tax=Sphingobium fuliginis (strain ATCC 27551) TaxID=336203 RepID=A0ABQ1ETX2_SPHSA|nr:MULTISPECIES: molybdate ABC transporter substrate-binding protein [Sphingobium]AJR24319.1 molybdenum ABC transporter substrate-binding protein [Sphingobium sp. YBL2]QDC38818.1 molybdate ABC transporter substrate-binding protein [Sphingobium fuliginis ATCC 27551]RYL99759.1 molybdate ABC transporter substrate-binding protein [Sphingobium fuliginis]UXC90647.1 molybdate ABC transporter substrate-binding protein [Sphingobium sp. RSMS]WDA36476.1 molybdate ABC transporter substrate-binding protein